MSGCDFVLTDYARKLIRFKARRLCRLHSFTKSDINQAGRFDPSRASLHTFIDRVVNTAIAKILCGRRRQKRANGFRGVSPDRTHAIHGTLP